MMNKAHQACLKIQYTFQPFAFYALGGLSEASAKTGRAEVVAVIQTNLRMSASQTERFCVMGFPPLRKIFPYLFHGDLAYRLGARAMLRKILRFVFLRSLSVAYRPVKLLFHSR